MSERNYHYAWRHWGEFEERENIIDSGNSRFDDEFKLLIKTVKEAIKPNECPIKALNFEKERITDFRYKLTNSKGTEHYERKFEWDKIINKLLEEING